MNREETSVQARDEAFTIFDGEGHLSDEAVAAVADGEGRVLGPAEVIAMAHVDMCEACGHRLGEAALASMALSEALDVLRTVDAKEEVREAAPATELASDPARSSERLQRPLPWFAITAALLVAVVSGSPALLQSARGLHATIAETLAIVPFAGRVALSVASAPWWDRPILVAIQVISAMAFLAVGVRIARAVPRAQMVQEGGER